VTQRIIPAICLALLAAPAAGDAPAPAGVSEVKAFFREGQTFLTWREAPGVVDARYRVYRHTAPITAKTIGKAKLLAEVPAGSSRFQEMWTTDGKALVSHRRHKDNPAVTRRIIPRLVIQPVSGPDEAPKMLAEDRGLFVHTVKETGTVEAYYAVGVGSSSAEDGDRDPPPVGAANTAGPIEEIKQPIGAVRYYVETAKDKKTGRIAPSREWYIMWMDYALWNPGYIGYAFPFAISPRSFKEGGPCPSAHLDGIGTMNVFTATYTNYGCGDFSRNALPTWYFGYGAKARRGRDLKKIDYKFKDTICNYVQYRILQTVLWARRTYRITDPRFIINGNSMGASGAIGFALQYPRFVTAIWSNEGLTDYADTMAKRHGRTVRLWAGSIFGNYGHVETANPVRFLPFGDDRLDWVCKWNGENVYHVRDAKWFLQHNVDVDMPFLNIGHCWQDGSIPAASQAVPFEKVVRDCRQCFSYTIARGGHGWGSAWGNGRMMSAMRWDESRPGFSSVPPIVGWRYGKKDPTSRTYMYKAAWGTRARPVGGKAIEETADSWTLPIIHAAAEGQEEDYVVDVTPRNLQRMKVKAGQAFAYEIKSLDGSQSESEGEITADRHGLLLVPKVPIRRSGALVVVRRK